MQAKELIDHLDGMLIAESVEVVSGHMYVEVKPKGAMLLLAYLIPACVHVPLQADNRAATSSSPPSVGKNSYGPNATLQPWTWPELAALQLPVAQGCGIGPWIVAVEGIMSRSRVPIF